MKQLLLGSTHLNQHRVWGHVNDQGLTPAPVLWGDTSSLPDDDVLKELCVVQCTPASMLRDLLAIQEFVGGAPIATVDHLHSPTRDGSVAPERLFITQTLKDIEQHYEIPLWSTASYIDEAGPSSMVDQNHWASSSEIPVGERLTTFLVGRQ
jgi:hypothetical protein